MSDKSTELSIVMEKIDECFAECKTPEQTKQLSEYLLAKLSNIIECKRRSNIKIKEVDN